ncbi:MAG: glycosyl hydrolase [bacterium]
MARTVARSTRRRAPARSRAATSRRTSTRPKSAARGTKSRARRVDLLVGTIKGAFMIRGGGAGRELRIEGPHFLGNEVNHVVVDPRDGRTMLAAAVTGHLGPTVFRSVNGGKTWAEAKRPPAFPKAGEGQNAFAVKRTFFLTPGHASEPDVWWAGTVPHAVFRSADGGVTWDLCEGFDRFVAGIREQYPNSLGETPGGFITHSILVDPRNASHLYVSLSSGGFFESMDRGESWRPLNEGVSVVDFLPVKFPVVGQDPHCAVMSPANPDRIYQQNHCGVYRLDRPGVKWDRIGMKLPTKIGDIGFPIVAHPRDPDTVWVFPMDGTQVWPRTSPDGKPATFVSRNGGKSWTRQAKGFPAAQAYFTVFRQAMKSDAAPNVSLYLGTTAGEIWRGRDEGESWTRVADHLPRILSVEVVER